MGFWNRFRRLQRPFWHLCYNCLRNNGNIAEDAIFYYDGPPAEVEGRRCIPCPRCDSINTRSFQLLKEEGDDPALFGLERIVKTSPRSRFPVKPAA